MFIQHLGDQYCYVTSMCTIISFYATAKQVLILLLIWLDLGSSVQCRCGQVLDFLITACQSDSEHHIAGRLITQKRCRDKYSNISLEFTNIPRNKLPHTQSNVMYVHRGVHTHRFACTHACTHNHMHQVTCSHKLLCNPPIHHQPLAQRKARKSTVTDLLTQ